MPRDASDRDHQPNGIPVMPQRQQIIVILLLIAGAMAAAALLWWQPRSSTQGHDDHGAGEHGHAAGEHRHADDPAEAGQDKSSQEAPGHRNESLNPRVDKTGAHAKDDDDEQDGHDHAGDGREHKDGGQEPKHGGQEHKDGGHEHEVRADQLDRSSRQKGGDDQRDGQPTQRSEGEGKAKAAQHKHDAHSSEAAQPSSRPAATPAQAQAHAQSIPMTAAQITTAGITLEAAGPALIRTTQSISGEIVFNEDRTAHVVPRVAGVVEAVPVTLGQRVKKGQVLAVLASAQASEQRSETLAAQKRLQLARTTYERELALFNEKIAPRQDVEAAEQALREAEIAAASAQQKLRASGVGMAATSGASNRFELRAPFDATIVEKHLTLGEQVKEDASIFVLSDLRTVWVRLDVPASAAEAMAPGEPVQVRSSVSDHTAAGAVTYVSPTLDAATRTAQARLALPNADGRWRPGLFVQAEVVTGQRQAAVTVAADAIHTLEGGPVVFVRTAEGFIARPVRPGRSDGRRTEVLAGLSADERYASRAAFIVKSEAAKGAATHSH